VGRFLQLSALKQGQRSFVIFPAGWNGRGWEKIFDALKEIIYLHSKSSGAASAKSSAQGPLSLSVVPSPLPFGCYPKCGFAGEPACFLRLFNQTVFVKPLRHALVKAEDPSSSKAVQANRGSGEGSVEFSSLILLMGKPESMQDASHFRRGAGGDRQGWGDFYRFTP